MNKSISWLDGTTQQNVVHVKKFRSGCSGSRSGSYGDLSPAAGLRSVKCSRVRPLLNDKSDKLMFHAEPCQMNETVERASNVTVRSEGAGCCGPWAQLWKKLGQVTPQRTRWWVHCALGRHLSPSTVMHQQAGEPSLSNVTKLSVVYC